MLALCIGHFPARDSFVIFGDVVHLFKVHTKQSIGHVKHGFHHFVQLQIRFDFGFVQVELFFSNTLCPKMPIPGLQIIQARELFQVFTFFDGFESCRLPNTGEQFSGLLCATGHGVGQGIL